MAENSTHTEIPEHPVIWDGRKFEGVTRFDCVVVDLNYGTRGCGGYFTGLPISDRKHREKSPTKASVRIVKEEDWTSFYITCDWGYNHVMKFHNSLKREIQVAEIAASDEDLLKDHG